MELRWGQTVEETAQEHPWNGLSCLSVVSYVLQFCSHAENGDLLDIIRRLDDLACDYHPKPLDPGVMDIISENGITSSEMCNLTNYDPTSPENLEIEREIAEIFVNNFMPKVKEFFIAPGKNGDLAHFIYFLLQILHSESDHIQDEESMDHFIHQGSVRHIQVGLTFFVAVLGDTPFQFNEMEEIKNLLLELESLANETGRFIYSFFFSSCPVNITPFSVGVTFLLGKIDFLNGQIGRCIKFAQLPAREFPDLRVTDAADALFIVHSLLEDLKNYSTFRVQLTDEIQVIKYQLTKLYKELISARSFLKEINVPQEIGIEDLKICFIQIRDIAYEAEYLINSFVAENFPAWYLAIRLPTVVHQLERIMEGCNEIRTIHGIEVLKVEDRDSSEVVVFNPMTASDKTIVGFEDEMIKILDELTGGSDKSLKIINIYGTPGIGKTTFARKLYNNLLIVDYFDECLWCTVSQTYRKRKVLIDLLMSSRSMHDKNRILKMEDESLVFNNESCPPQLCDLGKRIAVVAIAGTLANMAKENSVWEKVEKSLNAY